MRSTAEHVALVDLIAWIDMQLSNLALPADERSLLAAGCFDVALEHQAAIALLHSAQLPGSLLALLRVLSESLVRGLWLLQCATAAELGKFKKGRVDKTIDQLVAEFEAQIDTVNGTLSGFKATSWKAMNDFTHTGFGQITRRHGPGTLGANYPEHEISKALQVAGALGLIAAGQLIGMANRQDLVIKLSERTQAYVNQAA